MLHCITPSPFQMTRLGRKKFGAILKSYGSGVALLAIRFGYAGWVVAFLLAVIDSMNFD
jgi:hypothetical protein